MGEYRIVVAVKAFNVERLEVSPAALFELSALLNEPSHMVHPLSRMTTVA